MHFYKPEAGWVADVIPFFWEYQFHLFYLRDFRDERELGTHWEHVSTRDFVHYIEHPQAIPRGGLDDQDLWAYTGCVVQAGDGFQIYYTGHNSHFVGTGRPQEVILRATSDDLITWTKDATWPGIAADPSRYEIDDWRDPFIFWNPDANEYWMLLAARHRGQSVRRAGCLALATSPDLGQWTLSEPFWSPGLFSTHECPDLFQIGDWWYLVYSEYSDRTVARYRMARSLAGPWLCPPDDALDTRAFYAAKTVTDGKRRFLCGWNPTRIGETDAGGWQWGGNIVVHEVNQAEDGTLCLRPPDSVRSSFSGKRRSLSVGHSTGAWNINGETLTGDAGDGRGSCLLGELPPTCMVTTTIGRSTTTQACGLLLRSDDQMDTGYEIRWEPARSRIVVDRWPRSRDIAFELERPLFLSTGVDLELTMLIDETVLEVYANDLVALSYRMYDHRRGSLGCFTSGGAATFTQLTLSVP